ncbi:L-threonylcarbamoyladenylate synthase [Kineothrix sp. MB12-C1]|uniref:L-threonylcarbamoyladenylate synthase n=1 Tax=Kineothrix sp. MB12-C1 TaxID=3070215 RepID=UPI0027D2C35B|nr:L-threonylcarbamoyladenylate synthase [Kineothrix sp. MB12-C1]WMC94130.1 L-threonylcarbamoyladenylate synthase [Kineothrix sp. MB12-C1]
METKIVLMDEQSINEKILADAGDIIRSGGLVAFPTETVYGLGGDALNEKSSERIYRAKGRPSDNPLIVHICRREDMKAIVKEVPETAWKLAEVFWPGPLTMILHKSEKIPYTTTGGLDTVAVRMPRHKVALAFIEAAGGYIAAPSANTSGKPSPTLAKYVEEDMSGRIEMLIDGGEVGIGLESTIVDLTEEIPMILRPGYITKAMLEEVLGEVKVDRTILSDTTDKAPKAPGMKYRHYAPKGNLTIIAGTQEDVVKEINRRAERMREGGEKVGIIGTDATISLYIGDSIKSAGKREDEESIARALYRILREFDDEGVTAIYSEAFDDTAKSGGIGQAIMNRLLKAAGHHIEHIW